MARLAQLENDNSKRKFDQNGDHQPWFSKIVPTIKQALRPRVEAKSDTELSRETLRVKQMYPDVQLLAIVKIIDELHGNGQSSSNLRRQLNELLKLYADYEIASPTFIELQSTPLVMLVNSDEKEHLLAKLHQYNLTENYGSRTLGELINLLAYKIIDGTNKDLNNFLFRRRASFQTPPSRENAAVIIFGEISGDQREYVQEAVSVNTIKLLHSRLKSALYAAQARINTL